jgi:hypothetical protein
MVFDDPAALGQPDHHVDLHRYERFRIGTVP